MRGVYVCGCVCGLVCVWGTIGDETKASGSASVLIADDDGLRDRT